MKKQQNNTITWLLQFATQCKKKMISSVVLAAIGSACGIVPYVAVSKILTKLCNSKITINYVCIYAIIALIGYMLNVWLSTVSTILSHKSAFTILKNIRLEFTSKLSKVPMGTILDTPSGKFKTLLVDTVEKLELPLAHMIPELTANILIPIFMLVYLFVLDWRIALISLATIPIGLFCYMGMMVDYEVRYGRMLKAGKNMDAAIVEYVSGIEVIKTFNHGNLSYKKYTNAVKESRESKSSWFKKTNGFYVAAIAIMPSSLLGVLPLGSYLFIKGNLNAATFVTCIIISLGLIKPLIQALQYTDSLAMVDSTVKEIVSFLKEEELNRPSQNVQLLNYHVKLSDVSFSYKEDEVLHNISFETVPNGMTAIVGPSGSGKSTIAKLIASFWEAKSGAIKIDDIDVRKIPLNQIMNIVAYVSQDNFLFNISIRENIRIGKRCATDKEIEEAAKKASCHNFIINLPHGYDTIVGDGGSSLSGGERQRIAIARAILKNSPVVILDEATAFTDPENEAIIQNSINQLIKGKTLIVIAHRLSTIKSADRIVVMNNGCVDSVGKHEQLLNSSEMYQKLWESHIGGKDYREEKHI